MEASQQQAERVDQRTDEFEVMLTEEQRTAISWLFSPDNVEGGRMPSDQPITFKFMDGQLGINETWLHRDGEWATFPEQPSQS